MPPAALLPVGALIVNAFVWPTNAADAPAGRDDDEGEAAAPDAPHTTLEERLKPETLAAFGAALEAGKKLRRLKNAAARHAGRQELARLVKDLRLRPARTEELVGNLRALGFYAAVGWRDVGCTDYVFEGEAFPNRIFVREPGAQSSQDLARPG